MAKKSVSVPEEAYQYLKARADEDGLPIGDIVGKLVQEQRKTGGVPRSEAEQVENPRKLETAEIDEGMGYERKPDEVTARDGLDALYAISRGYDSSMGIDKS